MVGSSSNPRSIDAIDSLHFSSNHGDNYDVCICLRSCHHHKQYHESWLFLRFQCLLWPCLTFLQCSFSPPGSHSPWLRYERQNKFRVACPVMRFPGNGSSRTAPARGWRSAGPDSHFAKLEATWSDFGFSSFLSGLSVLEESLKD